MAAPPEQPEVAEPFLATITEASSAVLEEFILFDEEPNLSFQTLCKMLLQVAKQIATVNRLRLSQIQPLGSKRIPELEGRSLRKFSAMMRFGLAVAKRMWLSEECQADTKGRAPHVFLSHPGEEKVLYVPLLHERLEQYDKNLNIFLDTKDLPPGSTPEPDTKMFLAVLKARVLVFTCSHDFVQKGWTIAEFLCGLMRLEPDTGVDVPPCVLVDCMPGHHWLSRRIPDTEKWLSDVKSLFTQLDKHQNQKEMLSMLPCTTYRGRDHIQEVIQSIDRLLRPVSSPRHASFPDGAVYTPLTHSSDPNVCLWEAMTSMPNELNDEILRRVLQEQKEGTFAIRKSARAIPLGSHRQARTFDICSVRVLVVVGPGNVVRRGCLFYDSFCNQFVWIKPQEDRTEILIRYDSPHDMFWAMGAYFFQAELEGRLTYSSPLCQRLTAICERTLRQKGSVHKQQGSQVMRDDDDTVTSRTTTTTTDETASMMARTSSLRSGVSMMDESDNSSNTAANASSSSHLSGRSVSGSHR